MKAGNVIKPMKAPIATAWVDIADITDDGADGTNEVTTGNQFLDPSGLPEFHDLKIEIQYDQQRTSANGNVDVYVRINAYQGDLTTGAGGSAGFFYTGISRALTTRTRKILLSPSVIFPYDNSAFSERFVVRVYGKGDAVGTTWSVTNIRMRLIYIPL